jgi:hypothetical protein
MREWLDRSMAMHALTRDELVNQLWESAVDGQEELHFVLQARFTWESPNPNWHDVHLGKLAPDNADPPGSGFRSLMPNVPCNYGLKVPVSTLTRSDAPGSRQAILDCIRRAQVIADVASLVSGESVRLRAARRREMSWDSSEHFSDMQPASGKTHFLFPIETAQETTHTGFGNDDWLTALRSCLTALNTITDDDVKQTLADAISWHAQANLLHGFGRYIHYWASIELLGSFFYEFLDPSRIQRRSADAISADVLRRLMDLSSANYTKVVQECAQILNPPIREKILALADIVLPQHSDLRKTLYGKEYLNGEPKENSRNMYDLRNDIAHGNISVHDRSYMEQHGEKLDRFRVVSFEFIIRVLLSAPMLCSHRSATYTRRP